MWIYEDQDVLKTSEPELLACGGSSGCGSRTEHESQSEEMCEY